MKRGIEMNWEFKIWSSKRWLRSFKHRFQYCTING